MSVPPPQPLLSTLLEAEHATIYAYGLVGARLDDAGRERARQAYDSHRARRDQLDRLLRERGADPEPSEPAYDADVRTPEAALDLAVRLEEGLAVRWRDLVVGTPTGAGPDAPLRSLAVAGLTECAVRAAQWRQAAGISPSTVALPGTG
jgi:hypothetical protein